MHFIHSIFKQRILVFCEIGGTNFESEKRKCRVENDVIELGEKKDSQICAHPRRKHLSQEENKNLPKSQKWQPLKKTTISREHVKMTTTGEDEDEDDD